MNREEKTENSENKSTSQYLEIFVEIWYRHHSQRIMRDGVIKSNKWVIGNFQRNKERMPALKWRKNCETITSRYKIGEGGMKKSLFETL